VPWTLSVDRACLERPTLMETQAIGSWIIPDCLWYILDLSGSDLHICSIRALGAVSNYNTERSLWPTSHLRTQSASSIHVTVYLSA